MRNRSNAFSRRASVPAAVFFLLLQSVLPAGFFPPSERFRDPIPTAFATDSEPYAGKTIADLGWVAGGIGGMTDWDRIRHYNDEINNSRGFFKMNSGTLADTDAEGWPTEASYVVLGGGIGLRPGVHKGSFSGSAVVENHWGPGKIRNVVSDSGSTTFDYEVPDGVPDADGMVNPTNWAIRFSTGATNVRLIAPGVPTENAPMFSKEIVGYYAKFGGLRFMDPMGTNGNATTTWESRVKPTRRGGNGGFSVGSGKPVEHVVELANAAYREPGSRLKQIWVNVPHKATDDYVANFAAYLRDHLDPGIVVNVELSNETWNYSFAAESYFRLMAQAEVAVGGSNLNYDGADINTQRLRIMARRQREIALAFESAFGQGSLNSRIRMVLGLQAANGMRGAKSVLEYLKTQYPDRLVSSYLYAVSPAYYTHYDPAKVTDFQTEKDVFDDLEGTGSYWNNTANTVKIIGQIAAMARTYGLRTACYEGGPHLNDAPAEKRDLIASFRYSEWGRLHLKSVATKLWAAGVESLFFYQITPARHDWAVTENPLLALSFQAEQLKGMDELMTSKVPDPKIWNATDSGSVFLPKERLHTVTPASPVYDWLTGSVLSNLEGGVTKTLDFAFATATGGTYDLSFTGGYSSPGPTFADFSVDGVPVGSVEMAKIAGPYDVPPTPRTLTGVTVSHGFHVLTVGLRNGTGAITQAVFYGAETVRRPDPVPQPDPEPPTTGS